MSAIPAFDAYARCYDLLYRDKDYEAEAGFVHGQLRRHGLAGSRLLDLGCGTGAHAAGLVRQGCDVHGVDIAPAMLTQAQRRRDAMQVKQAARLTFSLGDVRDVRLLGRFDAVLSLFHVVSYQIRDADLAAMMHTAAEHLQPGGLFLFDFWYGPGVVRDPPAVRVKRVHDDDVLVTRLAEPVTNHMDNTVEVRYQIFVEHKAQHRVEQIRESHHLRYWFWPELQRHARAAGLVPKGLWAWLSDEPVAAGTWLAYAVCQAPGTSAPT